MKNLAENYAEKGTGRHKEDRMDFCPEKKEKAEKIEDCAHSVNLKIFIPC